MKTNHPPRARLVAAVSLVVALLGTAANAEPVRDRYPSPNELTAAPKDAEKLGLQKAGRLDVRSTDGERIGRVRDFIVDTRTGRVAFAVVNAGGMLGFGSQHIVPFGELKYSSAHTGFSTEIARADWEMLPKVTNKDFDRGRFTFSPDHSRAMERFARSAERNLESDTLFRASELRGKSLQIHGRDVGEIEDIVVDFDRGTAVALTEFEQERNDVERSFFIPLNRLTLTGDDDAITTSLRQSDFERVAETFTDRDPDRTFADRDRDRTFTDRDRDRIADDDRRARFDDKDDRRARYDDDDARRARIRDESPTPTGRMDPDPSRREEQRATLESAARSIKQSWERDPEIAKLGLNVDVDNNALILRGTVPTSRLWERAEDIADSAVSWLPIQNRIKIEER